MYEQHVIYRFQPWPEGLRPDTEGMDMIQGEKIGWKQGGSTLGSKKNWQREGESNKERKKTIEISVKFN